jgi:hypothetical protein
MRLHGRGGRREDQRRITFEVPTTSEQPRGSRKVPPLPSFGGQPRDDRVGRVPVNMVIWERENNLRNP